MTSQHHDGQYNKLPLSIPLPIITCDIFVASMQFCTSVISLVTKYITRAIYSTHQIMFHRGCYIGNTVQSPYIAYLEREWSFWLYNYSDYHTQHVCKQVSKTHNTFKKLHLSQSFSCNSKIIGSKPSPTLLRMHLCTVGRTGYTLDLNAIHVGIIAQYTILKTS